MPLSSDEQDYAKRQRDQRDADSDYGINIIIWAILIIPTVLILLFRSDGG